MRILEPVSRDVWWNIARACPRATFFHTPLWHELASATYEDAQDDTMGAMCNNDTRAVFPILQTGRTGRGLFRSLVSTFAGCYGGVIADSPFSKTDVEKLYHAALAGNVGSFQLTGNPLQVDTYFTRLPGVETKDDFNPSGGHESVARFKKHFGAEKWPIARSKYKDPRLRLAAGLKDMLR